MINNKSKRDFPIDVWKWEIANFFIEGKINKIAIPVIEKGNDVDWDSTGNNPKRQVIFKHNFQSDVGYVRQYKKTATDLSIRSNYYYVVTKQHKCMLAILYKGSYYLPDNSTVDPVNISATYNTFSINKVELSNLLKQLNEKSRAYTLVQSY